jgi:hypothetical protein
LCFAIAVFDRDSYIIHHSLTFPPFSAPSSGSILVRSGPKASAARRSCSEAALQEAKETIKRGESKTLVYRVLGLPETMLQRGDPATPLGRFKVTFSPDMEQELIEDIRSVDNMFCGLPVRSEKHFTSF